MKFAQNYLRDFNLKIWLADRDPHHVITSPAPHVLAIADKGDRSGKLEITLDPVTFLPVKQTGLSFADPNNPVPSETRFDKWASMPRPRDSLSAFARCLGGKDFRSPRKRRLWVEAELPCASLARRMPRT